MGHTEKQATLASRVSALAAVVVLAVLTARAEVAQNEPKRKILVSIPDRKLALIENGIAVKVYPVAVGTSATPSPTGQFSVIARLVKPTYYHAGKVIQPGPGNPLGTRWMGLSLKGYGIHGTNAPGSIGKAASHGCIRMAQRDLEELFELVQVGEAVEIRGEADSETATIFNGATLAQVRLNVVPAGAGQ
jgi:lipoprotein-anchoring transpeptidase ErfK/SrfK